MHRRLPLVVLASLAACSPAPRPADVLILGGAVLDGTGADAVTADVAVAGDRISFVGDAMAGRVAALDTVDAVGLVVAPGFVDMHSHAELGADHGRDARAFLFQGITSVALGMDGGGADVARQLGAWTTDGIGVNAFMFVGHNWVRRQVMATPPTSRCWTWPRSRTWPPTRTLTSTLAGPCTSWSTGCSRSGTAKPRRRWLGAPWCVAAASSAPSPGNAPRAADGPLPGGARAERLAERPLSTFCTGAS